MVELDSVLTGINKKDARSWEQLYTSCYAALCTYVESIISDMDGSEDIVQELLVSVWRSETEFRSSKELLGYLYRSSYNRSIDFLRKKKVRREALTKIREDDHEETCCDDFLLKTVREEITRQLHQYIHDLPKDRRTIVELSISGFSGKEIAEKLGISVNTVKVQKNRSIKYLRDRLLHARKWFEI